MHMARRRFGRDVTKAAIRFENDTERDSGSVGFATSLRTYHASVV